MIGAGRRARESGRGARVWGALGGTCHVRNCVQGVDHMQNHESQLRYVAIRGKRDDRRSRHRPVAQIRSSGTRADRRYLVSIR